MRAIERLAGTQLRKAMANFPAVVLTGPRRAGKTYLLRKQFPSASYHLLEDPQEIARWRADPNGFLDTIKLPAILDEIQNVPEIFSHVRARIDAHPRRIGNWILTGSQESSLMRGVTESMAGRAAIMQLWPLSLVESSKVTLLRGGFPEVIARPKAAALWFSSYMQSYLERDVRAVTNVQDLATFRRFLALVASRHGQILNKTDFAAPLGMSVPGIAKWLDILETTQQIIIVPPYFENLGKRLIKSPKIYVADAGLACHLLGIQTNAELERSPFLGAIFEGHVASEIVKAQSNAGATRQLFYFRDQQGLEVDFLVPQRSSALMLVECKAAASARISDAAPMARLTEALTKRHRGAITQVVVTRGGNAPAPLRPGAITMGLPEFSGRLNALPHPKK